VEPERAVRDLFSPLAGRRPSGTKRIVFDYCTGDEYGVKVLRARDGATVAKRQLSAGVADLLRWSPDSSTLAIFLHNSNDLQLLDMPEARPIRTTRINDYLGPELAAFAPDGKVLATSHYRATKLWNVEDGKLLHALPESYYMNALAFSPDGKVLATGGTGGEITLWSVEKGQAIRELAYTGEDTTALAFDPDGDLLATGSAYGEVHLRRTSDGAGGMLRLAEHRRAHLPDLDVTIRREDALASSLRHGYADRIVCGFGVKTLSDEQKEVFASEVARLLRPGGAFSLVEVSVPRGWWLKGLYMLYLKHIIPIIGWVLLGNPENYRMLGVYTEQFGDCRSMRNALVRNGLRTTYHEYFFGCASGVSGIKP
jgi:WD40 repeat protein